MISSHSFPIKKAIASPQTTNDRPNIISIKKRSHLHKKERRSPQHHPKPKAIASSQKIMIVFSKF
jgi:hypothetical protein